MIGSATEPAFCGTYEMLQDPEFAAIYARHYRLRAMERGGVVALLGHRPVLGYTRGIMGCPELVLPYPAWHVATRDLCYGCLDVHAGARIETLERYRISPDDNQAMVLDLRKDEEALFAACSKKTREAIRRGRRKGVEVRCGESRRELERFYTIATAISAGGRRFHLPPFSLFEELVASPYGRLMVAVHREVVIGGYFLYTGRNVHAWSGGIDRTFAGLAAGQLLLFESVLWCARRGYGWFNMGDQSLAENPALTHFKLGFGCELRPAPVYRLTGSTLKARGLALIDALRNRRR